MHTCARRARTAAAVVDEGMAIVTVMSTWGYKTHIHG